MKKRLKIVCLIMSLTLVFAAGDSVPLEKIANIIEDVFDYHYLVNDEELVVLIEKADGEEWELEIEKDYEEDLGITFEQGLMDEYRSCRNKNQGTTCLAATLSNTCNDSLNLSRLIVTYCNIVKEYQWLSTLCQNIVYTHCHSINTDSIVLIHLKRKL